MEYENVDAADMQHYLNRTQEKQSPAYPPHFHHEHYNIATSKRTLAPETATNLHRGFAKIELQSRQIPLSENALHGESQSENATSTSMEFGKLESQSLDSRRADNEEKAFKEKPNYPPDIPRERKNNSDDSDSDYDDEADKVAFHRAEFRKLLARRSSDGTCVPLGESNKRQLFVHLKCLVETYKVVDDARALLLLPTLYLLGTTSLGPNIEETSKCRDILADFKPNQISISPSKGVDTELKQRQARGRVVSAIYLIRAMAHFRLRDYPAAYKDCRRVIGLVKKLSSDDSDRGQMYALSAFEIATVSSKAMGDEGNMLYYGSLCGEIENQAYFVVYGNFFDLPTISELVKEVPSTTKAERITDTLDLSTQGPTSTYRSPTHIDKDPALSESPHTSIPGEGPTDRPSTIKRTGAVRDNLRDYNHDILNTPTKNITSQYIAGAESGRESESLISVSQEAQAASIPVLGIGSSEIIKKENALDVSSKPEQLPPSLVKKEFHLIIPPRFLGPIKSHAPYFGQSTLLHTDKTRTQISDSNISYLRTQLRIKVSLIDLVLLTDGHRKLGGLRLWFQSYDYIIRTVNHCIDNGQLNLAVILVKKGLHFREGSWHEIGYGYKFNTLPSINPKYNGIQNRFHFLGVVGNYGAKNATDIPHQAVEPGFESDYISAYASFLSLVIGVPLSQATSSPKGYLLHEAFIISLAVENTTMAVTIAYHATGFLTARSARTLPLLHGNAGFIMDPLPLTIILESNRVYKARPSLLSLLNRSFWEPVDLDCKIYDRYLFHIAAKFTTVSTQPLLYLFANHKCRRCLTKTISDPDNTHGKYVTPFDIVLSRAVSQIDISRAQYSILVDIANLFCKYEAAYINKFVSKKLDLEVLDRTGFLSLMSVRKISN